MSRSRRARPQRRFAAWALVTLLLGGATFATVAGLAATASPPSPLTPTTPTGPTARGETGSTGSTEGNATTRSYSVVVNKRRPLSPIGYVPSDLVAVHVPYVGVAPQLRQRAATAVEAMFAAFARETGLAMQSNSAYRSYSDQRAEYQLYSSKLGAAAASETTARPGYSEHQTGLAIDIGAKGSSCTARDCFADTAQSRWLVTNAWRFGFIIRYPAGQQAVTGYAYEPWHIRFVGDALAKKIHGHFGSLEAYFHLPAAPTY